MTAPSETLPITVISQNIYHDVGRFKKGLILHQNDRIDSMVATLAGSGLDLDVVGIQEAHQSTQQHNGEMLAASLGLGPGTWVRHNQKTSPTAKKGRTNEFIGMFGNKVDNHTPIDVGSNRKAMRTELADAAFLNLHLIAGERGVMQRYWESLSVTSALNDFADAVAFGDYNEPYGLPTSLARQHMKDSGFKSVFDLTDQPHPLTFPVPQYADAAASGKGLQGPIIKRGFSIDDIYVRGPRIRVLAAGIVSQMIDPAVLDKTPLSAPRLPTDHFGVWAKMELATSARID